MTTLQNRPPLSPPQPVGASATGGVSTTGCLWKGGKEWNGFKIGFLTPVFNLLTTGETGDWNDRSCPALVYRIYNLWKGSCNRQFIRVNHEEIRSCWKLLSYLIISCMIFPRVFKNEITMQFRRQLSHASFSRGLKILVKRVQLALRDAIQFLVIFLKYSIRVTVLLDRPSL